MARVLQRRNGYQRRPQAAEGAARECRSRRKGLVLAMLVATGLAAAPGACGGAHSDTPQVPSALPSVEAATANADNTADDHESCVRQRTEAGGPQRMTGALTSSTVVLGDWSGQTLAFVADVDDRSFHVVDVDTRTVLSTTALEGVPGQLLLLADGRLLVALRYRSQLQVFEPGANVTAVFERRCTVSTAPEPVALAVTPKDEAVLVLSGWGHSLISYAASTLAERFRVDLPRDPRAVVVSDDGATAFIAHAVGNEASAVDLNAKERHGIPLGTLGDYQVKELRKEIQQRLQTVGPNPSPQDIAKLVAEAFETLSNRFGNDNSTAQGYAIVKTQRPKGRLLLPYVFVQSGGRYSQTTYRFGQDHGQTHVPTVAVIDQATRYPLPGSLRMDYHRRYYRHSSGEEDEFCFLPRAAVMDPLTNSLLVACMGIDTVIAFDGASAQPVSAEKRRWRVGTGPTGIAVDTTEKRAVVWSQFSRTLNIIPLAGPTLEQHEGDDEKKVRRVELPATRQPQLGLSARLGRSLFYASYNSRISADGRACASCHPDGRDDGMVWGTPEGPRRTIMLAGRLTGTAPYSWDGTNRNLKEQMATIFKRLGAVGGLRGIQLKALLAYVRTLRPPPTTSAAETSAARGKDLFHQLRGLGGQ